MKINLLDLLMEHDIDIICNSTGYTLSADEMFVLGGEFVVYDKQKELYRGTNLGSAIIILEGN